MIYSENQLRSWIIVVMVLGGREESLSLRGNLGLLVIAAGTRSDQTWLEARSPASEVAMSRVRRFVPFPASSTLEVRKLTTPA